MAGAVFCSPLLFALFSFVTLLSFTLPSFALRSFALLSFARFSLALLFFDSCLGSYASTLGGDDFALGWTGACRAQPCVRCESSTPSALEA